MAKRKRTRATKRPVASGGKKNQRTLWIIVGIATVAVLVLVVVGALSRSGQQVNTAAVAGEGQGHGKVLGDPNAPVEVVDFSDFQCPHCRTFAVEAEQQLIEEYVRTGKVRLVYKHFIVIPNSEQAANASECASEQGKFWEYHDYLFERQETDRPFTSDKLKRYARDLGLDTKAFDACVDKEQYMDRVYQDTNEGRRLGVRGTPTIFVNGKLVEQGALWPDLKRAVDAALQSAQQ